MLTFELECDTLITVGNRANIGKGAKVKIGQLRKGDNAFLYCPDCGAKFSADARDYQGRDPETEMTCGGTPLVRVSRKVELVEV